MSKENWIFSAPLRTPTGAKAGRACRSTNGKIAELADEERKSFALKYTAVLGALAVAPESRQEGACDRLLAPEEAAPRMGTTAKLDEYKQHRKREGASNASINRELAALGPFGLLPRRDI